MTDATSRPANSAVRVLAIPAAHPYTRAISGDEVSVLADPPVPGAAPGVWCPHGGLEPDYLRSNAGSIDVVHLHFGYEHLTLAAAQAFTDTLTELEMPLVLTVHDLDNPHTPDQRHHYALRRHMASRAAAVLTLTEAAATVLASEGVSAQVVPHPHLAPLEVIAACSPVPITTGPRGLPAATVFVKSVRANTDLTAVAALTEHLDLTCYAHHDADLTSLKPVSDRLRVIRHDTLGDQALHAAIRTAGLCVLPYAFGSHSGWLELCIDLGVTPIVPSIGCYASQHRVPAYAMQPHGNVVPVRVELLTDPRSAATPAGLPGAQRAAWRKQQRDRVQTFHTKVYRSLS